MGKILEFKLKPKTWQDRLAILKRKIEALDKLIKKAKEGQDEDK
jgi:hypothetical protein